MPGYSFVSEGLVCEGQIVNRIGDHLVVEGLAQDSGSYFLRLAVGRDAAEVRKFPTRKEAEEYAGELAQDAKDAELDEPVQQTARKGSQSLPKKGDGELDEPAQQIARKGSQSLPKKGKDAKLATDPPVSEPQRKAMFAAREGRSTLGIPKKVGEEFVGKAKDARRK